jgi:hypothetical protein
MQIAKRQSKNQKLKPFGLSVLKIRELEHGFSYDLKKQSQFIRIAYCVMRIAERNLKKQSQLAGLWQTIPKACGFEAATQLEIQSNKLFVQMHNDITGIRLDRVKGYG